ncbi:NHL repeat-containing protein [Streptomyces albireticuli]|uniref:Teneurin NHL domain-containing protein n=1 Tax=Streptomyces albireticuli TaxID=1940 RepID=A0A2A2D100_9ACTN|nr:NHL repeat-containing protein [Streptomyces albireticuli]MCD9141875.1 SMP-30/gluconolactonase/LRE family protein [Streptomyces albireticuli]MCD9163181.1 SMP-30/gluconolactonase/LRE family protein [Streptomyces albireticuli]MCD9190049.1 SMP-30/gluconolactonase/LRE family protein [Streptomyces albireticuli]PAU46138.1 hypothetical protein CK936_25715 [Streptomyces albireticuli]
MSEPTVVPIDTVAGTVATGPSGEGVPATQAPLNQPRGVAVDAAGNVYIAEYDGNRVRRVDGQTLRITTVAGGGASLGDGGQAVAALLQKPCGVAVDPAGDTLYIADTYQHRVRKVDLRTGVISTVAGTGSGGLSGDGQALGVTLHYPTGVAVDPAGNVYVADRNNQQVRKLDVQARTLTKVAGTGAVGTSGEDVLAATAALSGPSGVAVDSAGNLYIAEDGNNRVRVVNAAGRITTVASGLNYPTGVAVDSVGNLYIADRNHHRVRKVDAQGAVTVVAGTGTGTFSGDGGPAVAADLNQPRGVAVDLDGNLYIADTGNQRVRKVTGITATARFSVAPGGPPDVTLTRAGETGYPGVRLRAETAGTVPPQTVRVGLPAGAGLQFIAESGGRFQLTVQDSAGNPPRSYDGTLSPDGQRLMFMGVDTGLSGRGSTSSMWVAVRASGSAPLGDTSLVFFVGLRHSASTPIHVVDRVRFSVTPGGPPDVTLTRADEIGYPGVRLRADEDGTVGPQTIRVALPEGRGLQFVAERGGRFQLTVQNAVGNPPVTYDGTLAQDGRTLVFEGVDPALSGRGSTSSVWVAVRAPDSAPPGETNLPFSVGGLPSESTRVRVVDPKAR